jgi:tetratricopeptide (TPR) repeat protein
MRRSMSTTTHVIDRPDRIDPPRGALARALLAVAGVLLVTCASRAKDAGPAATDPGQALYSQGKFAEALPLLEKSAERGKTGTLLYQIGFCKTAVPGATPDARKPYWAEARPLLEKEIAAPGGGTLDRLYYLTVISSDLGELEVMRKYARQAVDTIEKGPEPNKLTGDDWFRLGRLHDFLQESSEGEAAYRRAVSAFARTPAANPSYEALSLVRVADLDFEAHHFSDAAEGYTRALALVPAFQQVRPFRQGTALLALGRYDEAAKAYALDRDDKTATESQYAADIARKAAAVGGVEKADADGTPIEGMPLEGVEDRCRRAAKEFRAAREKNSWKPGDPLPAEVAQFQKRFISLMRERFMQTGEIQEFCLKEGMADLVRR